MADVFKGVVVALTTTATPDHFEGANDFVIQSDGHLLVTKGNVKVAVYAPGKWASAKLKV